MGRPARYRRGSITGSIDKYNIFSPSVQHRAGPKDWSMAMLGAERSAGAATSLQGKRRWREPPPPSFQLPWHPGWRALTWILVFFVPYLPITSPWHGRLLGSEAGEHSEAGWAASASSRTLSARDCGERCVSVGVFFSSTPEELSRRDTFPADWGVRY